MEHTSDLAQRYRARHARGWLRRALEPPRARAGRIGNHCYLWLRKPE